MEILVEVVGKEPRSYVTLTLRMLSVYSSIVKFLILSYSQRTFF